MKVLGEILFSSIYLLYGLIIGLYIFYKGKNKLTKLLSYAILILIIGDSFHLIPRILNYLIEYDFTMYIGLGKLITSITMTIFYIILYYIYLDNYEVKENKLITTIICVLGIIRILLCLIPNNNWLENNSPLLWQIYRNIPFLVLGFIILYLFYSKRKINNTFKYIWFYISLSFMFYIPVILSNNSYPIIGILMILKTVCYMLIIYTFKKKVK